MIKTFFLVAYLAVGASFASYLNNQCEAGGSARPIVIGVATGAWAIWVPMSMADEFMTGPVKGHCLDHAYQADLW